MFLCPLCGKQVSIRYFQPEIFDDEVEIFHNASLGYRKGFEKILGFDLAEFPELREKLENRIHHISEFLELPETQDKIHELEKKYENEKRKRITAEDELEEQDIELLLKKINQILDGDYTSVHSAADELISRAQSINSSNKNLRSINQGLQSKCTRLEQANKNLSSEINQLKNENKNLGDTIKQWDRAYRDLETQKNQKISEYSNALSSERNRRTALEEELEEQDLDLLLALVNNEIENEHTNLHSAINELIHDCNSYEIEIRRALDFINDTLPEEYDLYDDLGDALDAFYQYYEDSLEELR